MPIRETPEDENRFIFNNENNQSFFSWPHSQGVYLVPMSVKLPNWLPVAGELLVDRL